MRHDVKGSGRGLFMDSAPIFALVGLRRITKTRIWTVIVPEEIRTMHLPSTEKEQRKWCVKKPRLRTVYLDPASGRWRFAGSAPQNVHVAQR
jgi:hypothetical protein